MARSRPSLCPWKGFRKLSDERLRRSAESTSVWKERQSADYLELHAQISAILFRYDPVGINFESNTDEYEPEAQTILARLNEANDSVDVRRIADEEFNPWFSGTPHNVESLDAAADEIWTLWVSSQLRKFN